MVPKLTKVFSFPEFVGRAEKPYAAVAILAGVGVQTQAPVASGMMDYLRYRATFESIQNKTLGYASEGLKNAGRLALENAGPTIWSGLTLGAAWYVSKKIPTLCQWVAKVLPLKQDQETETAKRMEPFAKAALGFVTTSIVLQYWGIDMAKFILGLGVFSTAVGLALRDQISNILGGVFIKSGERFACGDYVQIGTKFGKIMEIGLTATTLEGVDDSGNMGSIKINNSTILNQDVTIKTINHELVDSIQIGDKFVCGETEGVITGENEYCFFYTKTDDKTGKKTTGILRFESLNEGIFHKLDQVTLG